MMVDSSLLLVRGLISITVGVLAFIWPGLTIAALVILLGVYSLIDGVTNVFLGVKTHPLTNRRSWLTIKLRKEITGEWLLILSGALSVIFGLLLFVSPGLGAVGLAWGLAAYAIASSAVLVASAVRRKTHHALSHA